MKFRLTYRGRLQARNSSSVEDKQELRRHFHQQLAVLWKQPPLNEFHEMLDINKLGKPNEICLIKNVGPFQFAPIVTSVFGWNAIAELEILFLRPSPPGALLRHGGDLDNRIKTLMDCLRVPAAVNEFPANDQPRPDEAPFFTLLEDDALVTAFSVVSDRLLTPGVKENDVELVIYVKVGTTRQSLANSILG